MLPIQVGPIVKNIVFQVLEKDLTYNILLGHPWIHEMQAIPSTYHQCLKFPVNGQEVTILDDYNNPQTCNMLKSTQDTLVPHNRESNTSSSSKGERKLNVVSKWVEKKDQSRETSVVDSIPSNNEDQLDSLSQ